MRKFIALCLGAVLALAPIPALAGVALISGTGTGGAQTNVAFNAGTSIGMQPTSSLAAGSLLAVLMSNQTSGGATGGWTCSDTKGNSYSSQAASAVVAAGVQTLWSFLTTPLTTSDTVTCAQISGPAGIVGQMIAFSGAASADLVATPVGTTTTSSVTSFSVGPTGTLNSPCPGTACAVLICNTVWQNTGATATDANFTSIAAGASSNWSNGFWIVNTTTAQSCTITDTAAGRSAMELYVFKATAGGAASAPKRSLMGVGQ